MTGGNVNIEFEYRYRDYGNFKNYNSVVFGNEKNLAVEEIDSVISRVFGDDRTFEASAWESPRCSSSNSHTTPNSIGQCKSTLASPKPTCP
jgi:hypothetical protein